ncbi:MAG: radical SAM family heme chaperone HemW [Pseudomonadota bacterium]
MQTLLTNSLPAASAEDWTHGGFGLYVHWPFCEAKCPYCDFNSHVVRDISQRAWRQAYLKELDHLAEVVPGRTVDSLFFGGGTPSLMDPETAAAIIAKVKTLWPVQDHFEATLEANPTSVEADKFRRFREAGINRISLGIQALNDTDLHRLGRLHNVGEALKALDIARCNFDRISFDLIYARQYQTPGQWQQELGQALTFAADHLSLYQLTIEPGTAFGARFSRDRLPGLPCEDAQADMYEITQDLCTDAGLDAYEVSNHAVPGSECRHNQIYWRYGDYAGIGPGAHGRLTMASGRFATETATDPQEWLNDVRSAGSGIRCTAELSRADQATECLMMGMRLSEGVLRDRLADLGWTPGAEKLSELIDLGLLEADRNRMRATRHGRVLLNSVLTELMSG